MAAMSCWSALRARLGPVAEAPGTHSRGYPQLLIAALIAPLGLLLIGAAVQNEFGLDLGSAGIARLEERASPRGGRLFLAFFRLAPPCLTIPTLGRCARTLLR